MDRLTSHAGQVQGQYASKRHHGKDGQGRRHDRQRGQDVECLVDVRRCVLFLEDEFEPVGQRLAAAQSRDETGAHERRLAASRWPVQQAHATCAFICRLGPRFPEANALGHAEPVLGPRNKRREETRVFGLKRPQAFGDPHATRLCPCRGMLHFDIRPFGLIQEAAQVGRRFAGRERVPVRRFAIGDDGTGGCQIVLVEGDAGAANRVQLAEERRARGDRRAGEPGQLRGEEVADRVVREHGEQRLDVRGAVQRE